MINKIQLRLDINVKRIRLWKDCKALVKAEPKKYKLKYIGTNFVLYEKNVFGWVQIIQSPEFI